MILYKIIIIIILLLLTPVRSFQLPYISVSVFVVFIFPCFLIMFPYL